MPRRRCLRGVRGGGTGAVWRLGRPVRGGPAEHLAARGPGRPAVAVPARARRLGHDRRVRGQGCVGCRVSLLLPRRRGWTRTAGRPPVCSGPRRRSAYFSPWAGPRRPRASSVAELGRLEAAFAYASGGDPVTLCVGGEAGVGKTRLVTRFAGQVRGSGGQVLLGGCIELGEGSLPYLPVAEALRGLGRGLQPAALDELVGPGRPLLARLLPELGQGEESTSAGLAVGWSAQARLYDAFLAEELLAAALQGDGRSLSPSLKNVLLSRVQVLPENAQATLRTMAAASGRVEHELLATVSELPEADLLAALRAAVAHQVLVPDPATETYAFRHALTQEALYGELLPGDRARLHAGFARVLTEHPELAAPNRLAAPARLAYHWVRAHDPARALPAAVEAGLQCEAAYGFADAQRHFETALELWGQVADPEERLGRDRAAVLQHAAESAYLAGDPNRAITLTQAALADVDAAKDPVRAGLLHGRLGGYLRATGGEGAFAQYEAAVRLVPTSPPLAERAQVLAAFGEALIGQGRYRESRDLCEEAIAIAGQIGALAEEG